MDLFSIERDGFKIKNENDQFYIEANLETEDVNEVREEGEKIVSRINGALKLFLDKDGNIQLVESKALRKIGKDGNSAAVFVSGSAEMKATMSGKISVGDSKGNITIYPDDDISAFVKAGSSNSTINKVLKLSTNLENWVNLYRIYELIEEDIGSKEDIANFGWASVKRIKLLKHTANSSEAIGSKARHGHKKYKPPKNPMSLKDAKALIKKLILR